MSYCGKNLTSGTGGAKGEVGLLIAHKLYHEGHSCPFPGAAPVAVTRKQEPEPLVAAPGAWQPSKPTVLLLATHITAARSHLPSPAAAATWTRHLISQLQ